MIAQKISFRMARARTPAARRTAALLVAALVCLVVVLSVGASLLRTLVGQQRQLLQEQRQAQVFWLVESALDRAAAQLAAAADYRGETWEVDGPAGTGKAVAVIRVEPAAGEPPRRKLVVEVQYPCAAVERVTQRREVVIP